MNDSVFFLTSKRFWSMPVGFGLGKIAAWLGAAGFAITPDQATTIEVVVTGAIVWLVGMVMGKRGVSIAPAPAKPANKSRSGP